MASPHELPNSDVTTSQAVRIAPVEATRFDDYSIVGKLGHGGMAEVFLALEEGPSGFRKLVVIKRLLSHLGDEPEMVRMFLDEARLAARLNHPHVVQTNKIGTFEGRQFMAMEYLDGQALSKLLKRADQRGERLPPALVARIASDALDGLAYAHDAKDFDGAPLRIVHRDVSPQNVFVTYDGAVKILDFGIAKAEIQEARTRTGLVKGKFGYIAPEQAQGATVDRRADLWSMGVVFWEMLAGKRLFKAANEIATLSDTLTKSIEAPHVVDTSVPRELSEIAMRALQRDLALRYQSAHEMKDEIDEWLAASSRSGSRRSLAKAMRELFADTIEEQRDLIRSCVERADAGKAAVGLAMQEEVTQLEPPSRPDASAVRPTPQQGPAKNRGVVVAIVAAALVATLAIAIAASFGDDAPPRPVAAATAPRSAPPPRDVPALAHEEPAPAVAPSVAAEVAEPSPAAPAPAAATKRRPIRAPRPRTPTDTRAPGQVPADPAPQAATGRLTLDTEPWSIVSLNGRRLGMTPLVNVEIPAGTHLLSLRNDELDISTTYRVAIPEGGTVTRRLVIE